MNKEDEKLLSRVLDVVEKLTDNVNTLSDISNETRAELHFVKSNLEDHMIRTKAVEKSNELLEKHIDKSINGILDQTKTIRNTFLTVFFGFPGFIWACLKIIESVKNLG